jgi:hypothetical protein
MLIVTRGVEQIPVFGSEGNVIGYRMTDAPTAHKCLIDIGKLLGMWQETYATKAAQGESEMPRLLPASSVQVIDKK